MVSSLGELSYRRRVYRCSRCGAEHAPLDGALGGQIQALSLSQGLRQAVASQFISDAGNWMRGRAEGVLGWSSWTVDYYHASAQVASALEALHGPGAKPMQRAHRRLRRKLLKASGNAAVRRSLTAQSRRRRLTPDNERTVARVVSYLERHEAQTRYDPLRRWQWPIGRGMIEGGGCKLYIQQRFKRHGARWSERGFDNLEAIRRFLYNDQWDRFRSLLYSQN